MFNKLYKEEKHPWGEQVGLIIIKNEKILKRNNILDLACGDGKDILYLATKGFEVTGVDFADLGLNTLNEEAKKANVENNVKTINQNVFDYIKSDSSKPWANIFSFMTLHFLSRKEAKEIYEWIKQKTEIGGINIIQDFTNEGEFDLVGKKGFYLKKHELLEIYKGWEIINHFEKLSKTKAGLMQTVATIVARKI